VSGDLKVLVVRYRRKYYATNRLSLSAKEVRTLYRKCQEVEEVIRILKSELGLEACQAGYRRSSNAKPLPPEGAQEHHIALCLVAYLIVERERLAEGTRGGNASDSSSSLVRRVRCLLWSGCEALRRFCFKESFILSHCPARSRVLIKPWAALS
jgi:hypothetical protein